MIPGGIADKLGNRYEAKWLALKLIDVVRGQASMLCFEGTGEAFAGFEFLVEKGSEKQWHQVKISASFEFRVGGVGGSRAGVSPAQRTLEAL